LSSEFTGELLAKLTNRVERRSSDFWIATLRRDLVLAASLAMASHRGEHVGQIQVLLRVTW